MTRHTYPAVSLCSALALAMAQTGCVTKESGGHRPCEDDPEGCDDDGVGGGGTISDDNPTKKTEYESLSGEFLYELGYVDGDYEAYCAAEWRMVGEPSKADCDSCEFTFDVEFKSPDVDEDNYCPDWVYSSFSMTLGYFPPVNDMGDGTVGYYDNGDWYELASGYVDNSSELHFWSYYGDEWYSYSYGSYSYYWVYWSGRAELE